MSPSRERPNPGNCVLVTACNALRAYKGPRHSASGMPAPRTATVRAAPSLATTRPTGAYRCTTSGPMPSAASRTSWAPCLRTPVDVRQGNRSPGPGTAGADLTRSISAREHVALWRVYELAKNGNSWQHFYPTLGLISEQRKPLHRRRGGRNCRVGSARCGASGGRG
jgi:hypothetical protein